MKFNEKILQKKKKRKHGTMKENKNFKTERQSNTEIMKQFSEQKIKENKNTFI